jgi:DNA-binding transcriptional LysR family regulator
MVKVIHLADDGTEQAAVVLDDFTVEVIYSGIADMLRDAAAAGAGVDVTPSFDLPREARQRREKLLTRIRS